jgi:hypothetical protein
MMATDFNYALLVAELPKAQRVRLAARCAGFAVRLVNAMSLPIDLEELAGIEDVVRLVEESLSGSGDPTELQRSMYDLRRRAFDDPAECRYRSDRVLGYVVRTVYAAGHAALNGSTADTEDALRSAFAAAHAARSDEAEDSLWEALRQVGRAAVEASDWTRATSRCTGQAQLLGSSSRSQADL